MTHQLAGGRSTSPVVYFQDFRSDTYRAVYTVNFAGWIYVLHCFQKKSKRGIKTPKEDMELINVRLKAAKRDYEVWQAQQGAQR
jgi:phage-related protein